MTPEDAAKTLFTVESAAPFIYAHHHQRFRASEVLSFHTDDVGSRLSTPAEDNASLSAHEVQIKTYLRFTVDNVGDQTTFVFGSERETCDVWVSATHLSRRLFALELEDHGRSVMLKNLSNRGTDIQSPLYERQRFKRSRRCLHPGDQVTVFLPGLSIQLQVPDRDSYAAFLHQCYLQKLHAQVENALPLMNPLALDSMPASSTRSQATNPYHLYEELGSGAYGTVYRAKHSYTGATVAIKVFRKRNPLPLREAAILQSVSHPNIVRFIGFISPGMGSQGPMLVMELLEHPNLEDVHSYHPLSLELIRDLMAQLLHALAYLHAKHITHRDLKPSNIIVTSRMPLKIKVTDFGLAIARSDDLTSNCGTIRYLAPESQSRCYTNKVDIWAVGVIALELGLGLPDYPDDTRQCWPDLLRGWMESASLDPLFLSFVKPLLSAQADCRPSAQESLTHPFLRVEAQFLDALGSPTEYAPTPSEYRAQPSPSGQPESSSAFFHRSTNAPSPSDHELDAGQTQIFAPLPEDPFAPTTASAPAPAPAPAPLSPLPLVHYTRQANIIKTYWKLKHAGVTVMYRPEDSLVNITHLSKAIGYKKTVPWDTIAKKLGNLRKTVVKGRLIGGTYVSMEDGQRVLRHLELPTAALHELREQIPA